MSNEEQKAVYIVETARTPFLKATGKQGDFSASDLAVAAGREILLNMPFSPEKIDEVVIGCVMPSPEEANIARYIALRLGCGKSVPAYTVQRNCASGLQAIDSAAKDIQMGRADLVLAGGTEVMSRAPVLFNGKMVNWLSKFMGAKTPVQKLSCVSKFRPAFLAPVISLLKGLTDHFIGLSMGQTAENLAYKFDITREEMDAYSMQSHHRLANGVDNQYFNKLKTLFSPKGKHFQEDEGLRRDSSMENLAKLKPYFDKKFGMVTPGNSSQVTDGSAMLLLASEDAVRKYNLPVLGKIVDTAWAANAPEEMGLGPVHAIAKLLKKQNLALSDIDYFEINEAFAAQVLACVKALNSDEYCKTHFDRDSAIGEIPMDHLNVDGGAISIGHPIGASGARISVHLLDLLSRKKARLGIATLCIGGGQGGAMLFEQVDNI